MRACRSGVGWGVGAATLGLLSACALPRPPDAGPGQFAPAWLMARNVREAVMNGEWQNHTLSDLVAAKGQPKMVLQIPGGGNPPGFIVVYGVDPDTGCIDAFAVTHETAPRVRIYHCR